MSRYISRPISTIAGAAEVPTLQVGRSVHRGFEQTAFDSLLDTAGYPRAGLLPPGNQKAPPPPEGHGGGGRPPAPGGGDGRAVHRRPSSRALSRWMNRSPARLETKVTTNKSTPMVKSMR